ncbi:MAG: alpha/beta hydrolase [Solirubrobacterales bacterium]
MSDWIKEDVRFKSGDGECGAWLYKPEGVKNPPVVVLCHGLGATRERRLDAYCERFAEAGIAALAFTYRHFGDSSGSPRQLLDIGKQRADIRSALRYARARRDLDGTRVALWGSSFGGGHVMSIGAEDPNLLAVVAQCPFTDGLASGGTLGPVSTARLGVRAIADAAGSLFGCHPIYGKLSGRPGDPAMMTAPDVVAGMKRLAGDKPFDNDVSARAGLAALTYRPGRRLKDIACPVLVCVCEKDTVAPASPAIKYVEQSPNASIKTYPIGHFDIYFDKWFERAVSDQTAFLQDKLGVVVEPVAATSA